MRLRTKIIIFFTGIVILMALLQAFFFQNRIVDNFAEYIKQNEYERMEYWKENLKEHYKLNHSWVNIQDVIDNNILYDMRPGKGFMGRGNGMGSPKMMSNIEIIVADNSGRVVGATDRDLIGRSTEEVVGVREDIVVEGKKVGDIIYNKGKNTGFYGLEKQFVSSVRSSLLLGFLLAVIIAAILGLILSNKITKPLNSLMRGIHLLSKGDNNYRVKVNTKDEFYHLANSFNQMAETIKKNEEIRKSLVADVAHELRTPLAVLSGRLESIQEGAIEPNQAEIVLLSDEVLRLTRLVNDLQQLTLAESGSLPLHKENVNLKDLIDRVIFNFSWLAEEKGIDIIHDSEQVKVNIDYDRITQVIINVLGNALRHTPNKGKVTITSKTEGNHVLIKIKDNGPGIEEEQIQFIFERFYRTDSSRNRDQGGTGLGLAIAKGYVEAHHGNIVVESKQGEGTSLTIMLPIE